MISIDTLPDDALLLIFYHLMHRVRHIGDEWERADKAWRSLVHVCRRWRRIVFQSPRHLNLWLVCTSETPARDKLDVWPALPLIILAGGDGSTRPMGCTENIVAALKRNGRVCQIDFENITCFNMEMILAAMGRRFPELTYLRLRLPYDA